MSSILSSQGMVLATAMAVSGTVILLAFRRQKTQFAVNQISQSPQQVPRSCISPGGKQREEKKKKKKKVHFAEDVVDPAGNSEDFRKQRSMRSNFNTSSSKLGRSSNGGKVRGMPANRVALYNGILRDRVVHRLACAY